MTALAVTVLQVLSCLGLGAAGLRALRLNGEFTYLERAAIAFALGSGLLGWLVFPLGVAGLLDKAVLGGLLVIGAGGVWFLGRPPPGTFAGRPDRIAVVLIVLLLTAAVFNLLYALSPPGEADTLGYHFSLPKQFLAAGRIEFVPRIVDGAVPMLVNMTYLPALALGGEGALMLWTMVTGWAAVAMLYVLCRRHLDRTWSLAVGLVFMTTPAVVYGAGSGMTEVRIALFVIAAALAASRAVDTGRLPFAVLAGLAAGFYMGGKYTGLLFAVACAVALLFHRRRLSLGAAYGLAVLAAGFQWYAWNWLHTGDPVFPMLYDWLGRADLGFWDAQHQAFFMEHKIDIVETAPRTPLWFLAYPLVATLDGLAAFQSGRIGFGPYGWVLLPFAAAGLWRHRSSLARQPWLSYASIVLVFYALWFFSGSSQRVRHLLPVLPLGLLCLSVAARRLAGEGRALRPLAGAVALTLAVQLAGHGVFTVNFARHVLGGETREAYYARNISRYQPIPWINANLSPRDLVLVGDRQYLYLLEVPYFFAHAYAQSLVNVLPGEHDPRPFWDQIRKLGISHLLAPPFQAATDGAPNSALSRLVDGIEVAGCLVHVKTFEVTGQASRTLPGMIATSGERSLFRVDPEGCRYGR